jgi:hypothetical protein
LVTLWFKEPNYRGGVGRRRLDLFLVGASRRPTRGDFCPDLPFSADGGACLPEVLAGRSGLPGTAGPVARETAGEGRPHPAAAPDASRQRPSVKRTASLWTYIRIVVKISGEPSALHFLKSRKVAPGQAVGTNGVASGTRRVYALTSGLGPYGGSQGWTRFPIADVRSVALRGVGSWTSRSRPALLTQKGRRSGPLSGRLVHGPHG